MEKEQHILSPVGVSECIKQAFLSMISDRKKSVQLMFNILESSLLQAPIEFLLLLIKEIL